MERLLLLGYFGAGNFGDDALLTGWLVRHKNWLEEQGLSADITISGDFPPVAGFVECAGLSGVVGDSIPRNQLLNVDPREYQALVVPGGSLLQDETSLKSLLFYLWVIRGFITAGKPVYLLNQGIGPLRSFLARWLTPRYLKNVKMISFRDRDSYHWAREQPLLNDHPQLHLVCDPMLDPPFAPLPPGELDGNLPDEYALIIPRPTGDLPYPGDATTEAQALAALIRVMIETSQLTPVLLPLHGDQDAGFCEEIQSECSDCRISKPVQAAEHFNTAVLSIIAGASMVVSHRLHGLISAVAHGVPVFGVAYDPKIISFCDELCYPFCFPATAHNETTAADFRRLWENRAEAMDISAGIRNGTIGRLHTAQECFYDLW